MRRGVLVLVVAGLLCLVLVLSKSQGEQKQSPTFVGAFSAKVEKTNPWTHLKPNAGPGQFQFAVVSDRTGGHRPGIFSKAVQQINLLQPEFVMSVGDLIEGSGDRDATEKQWQEFNSYVSQFQMPFFYVPGNHDAANLNLTNIWKEKYGRRNYHFLYQNCLFVGLNSNDEDADDPKDNASYKKSRIGKNQRQQLEEALKANPEVRWTFLFLHHPIWNTKELEKTGWLDVEKIMEGRKYTVFCGHLHTFRKYVRNGANYYQLATTGGSSSMRGIEYGEFDQVAWITMKDNGPLITHVALQGIQKEDLGAFESDETGKETKQAKGNVPVGGRVIMEGKPVNKLLVTFQQTELKAGEKGAVASGRTNDNGMFEVYSNRSGPGVPPGKYRVTFSEAPSFVIDANTKAEKSKRIPERYQDSAVTPIEVEVLKTERKNFDFDLK